MLVVTGVPVHYSQWLVLLQKTVQLLSVNSKHSKLSKLRFKLCVFVYILVAMHISTTQRRCRDGMQAGKLQREDLFRCWQDLEAKSFLAYC